MKQYKNIDKTKLHRIGSKRVEELVNNFKENYKEQPFAKELVNMLAKLSKEEDEEDYKIGVEIDPLYVLDSEYYICYFSEMINNSSQIEAKIEKKDIGEPWRKEEAYTITIPIKLFTKTIPNNRLKAVKYFVTTVYSIADVANILSTFLYRNVLSYYGIYCESKSGLVKHI